MTSRKLAVLFALCFALAASAFAGDISHARIVRLSYVQGDVRFASEYKGDPMTDTNANWQTAVMNLPLRQGYVIATGDGRAEIEFENGELAFLDQNSVLEFFDLSRDDADRITRLILRQGSAEFSVRPLQHDYFSVTGGDFSVEALHKTTFRMNNFDDGSTLNVLRGALSVLPKDEDGIPLERGQSYSAKVGDEAAPAIGHALDTDEFDQWASNRIEQNAAATATAAQAAPTPYGPEYTSGYSDLYTYGAWSNLPGYGLCWQPYGVGAGWSPFDYGSWYYDNSFGWGFVGAMPWGWLPYHYGGWVFNNGWYWNPGAYNPRRPLGYRPVTGVWVHNAAGTAIVPVNPMDRSGRPPLNLEHGLYPVNGRSVSALTAPGTQEWKTEHRPGRDALTSSLVATTAPSRVPMSIANGGAARVVNFGNDSSIVYDPHDRRFVNSTAGRPSSERVNNGAVRGMPSAEAVVPQERGGVPGRNIPSPSRATTTANGVPQVPGRNNSMVPAARAPQAPPEPRSGSMVRGGGWPSGGGSRVPSSAGSSFPAGSAPHTMPSSGPSGGGGRPH